MKEKTKKYLQECENYVNSLKSEPHKVMENAMKDDEICFLQETNDVNENGEKIFHFGVGKITDIERMNGKRQDFVTVNNIRSIHITSASYPFVLELKVEDVLKNYTFDKERK